MLSYHHPPRVEEDQIGGRPVLITERGGKIAVDAQLLDLWRFADGKSAESVLKQFHPGRFPPGEIKAGLACLVEAGLLSRESANMAGLEKSESQAGPLVSIVMVVHNNLEWLADCLESINNQTYESIELHIVDNASSDKTGDWITANYPWARVHCMDELIPFAQAINQGVMSASGEYLLLLNPDTVLEPGVVADMTRVAQENQACGAVAAKLKLLWAPGFLNGIGNRVGAFSWGVDNGLGHLDFGQFDDWDELPSACFAAALIPRAVWEEVGPSDEKFPMYYEDSEWSYRARELGYQILAAPSAIVYHAFGGRIPGGVEERLSPKKLENVVYGRLRFAYKLLDGYLGEFLLSYLATDLVNIFRYLILFKLKHLSAILRGYRRFLGDLPEIRTQRKIQQAERVLSDKQLFAVQQDFREPLVWRGLPELSWDLIRNYYLPILTGDSTDSVEEFIGNPGNPRLLIISHDVIDEKLAGPGMRYLELGRTLSSHVEVTIAAPNSSRLEIPGLTIKNYHEAQPASLHKLVEACDIVLVSSFLVERLPFLWDSHARVIVDLYDPFVLENLHYYLDEPLASQESLNQQSVEITNQLTRVGDFFICGNERQRDYWLGVLTANGRVNPRNYRLDPELRALIDVVGIGYPDRPPESSILLRGIHPQVPHDAQIVLWGGGIWNWLDPITLIKAWPEVIRQYPKARLIFLGTRHPNPDIPGHKMASAAQSLADDIGEKDKSIIFFEWLSYQDREALLSEANIGVSLHPVHIETRYSIRTRILDYIWARLPIITTSGDIASEWIRGYGLGQVVSPNDQKEVEQALLLTLSRPKASWAAQFEAFGGDFTWGKVAAPLQKYCLTGTYAPDRIIRERSRDSGGKSGDLVRLRWARARFIYRTEGWRGLSHRLWRYVQREIANP